VISGRTYTKVAEGLPLPTGEKARWTQSVDGQGGQHKDHFTLLLTDFQNKILSQAVKVINTELLTFCSIVNIKQTRNLLP